MFVLRNQAAEPVWLDLPQGVRVKMRPLDGVILGAAQQRVAKRFAAVQANGAPAIEADQAQAMLQVELAAALAHFGALDWEGVNDDADQPMPFTQQGAERLARHAVMSAPFLTLYHATLDAPPAAAGTADQASPRRTSGRRRQR